MKQKQKAKKHFLPSFEDRYAGKNSESFWDAINSSPKRQSKLYSLGVALQNLEHQVLNALNDDIITRKK
jgi:hypothetical protein